MFIEQIIEFELREPGPSGRTCTPKTGYSHDKTKISKANIRANIFCKKYCKRQIYLASPTGAKSLTKFNPQIQDLNVLCT